MRNRIFSTYAPIASLAMALAMVVACKGKTDSSASAQEDKEAERSLQGIWVDGDTDEVMFKVAGDSIQYPDSTSQTAAFKIIGDTLVIGSTDKYPIVKQSPHTFWFKNPNGDVVKLDKSDDPDDALAFEHESKHGVPIRTEVSKSDTVVMYNGERYHCYIAINPTKYKVVNTTYNSDGVAVDNVYYDNIIHISIFKGAAQLYSKDINKRMYSPLVPNQFLSQAILTNMEFGKADSHGFHFNATICVPDGASCYMLDTRVSFEGKLAMELLEY